MHCAVGADASGREVFIAMFITLAPKSAVHRE
jgi:hypothetical protein